MASTQENPGFLSKVARFVRNPLTNWSDLDQAEDEKEKTYSKAALKQMIERKRRNDFVRRREFDQLRKLRSRGRVGPEAVDRPSFFQSSLPPSTSDERAGTLRKIDEIEAQMAQQWWKGKPGADGSGAEVNPTSAPTRDSAVEKPAASGVPAGLFSAVAPPQPGSYPATEPMPLDEPGLSVEPSRYSMSAADEAGVEPDLTPASAEPAFAHDPDLEEAAIRFANGDYEGAEAVLLPQIAPGTAGIERAQTWLTLFDLYRATGRHDRFDSIAIDFARRFGRSAPVWFAMAQEHDQRPPATGAGLPLSRGFSWTAPEVLLPKSLSALETALVTAPRPWRLNWSRLASIDESALDSLLPMVQQWCLQPGELRFVGARHLLQLLADATPTGEASVDQRRWRLRMEVLRLMGQVDEFDLAALEFCITYEVSPPSWTDPQCACQEIDADGSVAAQPKPTTGGNPTTMPGESGLGSLSASLSSLQGALDPLGQPLELAGLLVGDVGKTLDQLDQRSAGARSIAVSCDRLARVDFSAAGSVLNWAAARHADGCQIEFNNVQRLVAVFFNIIGINEYARVAARRN